MLLKRNGVKLFFAVLLFCATPATAKDATVVELFTSQGCSSCPPADSFLAELADRPDVVALEYHIDYWDKTITFSGSWKDPFSKPEWTRRQGVYAGLISGSGNVYTPQIIVDGRYAEVGHKKGDVLELIQKAKEKRTQIQPGAEFTMAQALEKDGSASVTFDGGGQGKPLEVILVLFAKSAVTEVKAGENKGERLVNRNIVLSHLPLGIWHGGKQAFHFPPARISGEGCAIILQDKVDRNIEAAQYCRY